MKCANCDQTVLYTPEMIMREATSGGYMVKKLEAGRLLFENMFFGKEPDVVLNYRLLREAIGHCICDLDRLTTFRGMDSADSHKRAAYLIKWLAKVKPVQPVISRNQAVASPKYSRRVAMANDYFAIYFGIGELDGFGRRELSDKYIDNMAYLLHHHSVDADFLSSELYVLDMYLKGGEV